MFERYDERAQRIIFFARFEASQFGSPGIETEHLLLGLIRESKAVIARFIVQPESQAGIRNDIVERTPQREKVSTSIDLPLSIECKRILSLAVEEADRLNHRMIGPEHLLLGMLREEKCMAAELLHARGVALEAARRVIERSFNQDLFPKPISEQAGSYVSAALDEHGFTGAKQHLDLAYKAAEEADWETAQAELQRFLETLVDLVDESLRTDERLEESETKLMLRNLQTGLSDETDWRVRKNVTLVFAEFLLRRLRRD